MTFNSENFFAYYSKTNASKVIERCDECSCKTYEHIVINGKLYCKDCFITKDERFMREESDGYCEKYNCHECYRPIGWGLNVNGINMCDYCAIDEFLEYDDEDDFESIIK